METTTSSTNFMSWTTHHHPLSRFPASAPPRRTETARFAALASKRDAYGSSDYGGGRLVDESMIVLRKRIHEMKVAERNYEPPEEWMEWEKQYYTSYAGDVCDAVAVLQTLLMNTRPSLAIGAAAVVALSVPASATMVLVQLIGALSSVFSGVQLK